MNTAVARENWVGHVVDGRFPLFQWLGGSERGIVFRTELPGQKQQKAAIKLIPVDTENAEKQISRWRLAATLSHPHLLRIFDAGLCQLKGVRLLYVVMEYAEEDLSQVLPVRPLSPREAGEMLRPVLDALSYIHAESFVHGGIKPSNIMAVDNQIKLSGDSVHRFDDSSDKGRQPTIYDAPELTIGAVSGAADVWSIGATLVTALSQSSEVREKADARELGVPDSIPEPFRQIARGCLRLSPGDRCTLQQIKDSLQPVPARPTPPHPVLNEPIEGSNRGAKSLKVAVVALLVLLAVFLGLRLTNRGQQSQPAPVTAEKEQPPADIAPSRSQPPASNSNVQPAKAETPSSVIERVIPDVPLSARNTIQGKVRVSVRVAVDLSGGVSEATLTSPGPSRYFARLAREASQRWKFKPAVVDGQPVESAWLLHFRFGRTGTEVDPVPTTR